MTSQFVSIYCYLVPEEQTRRCYQQGDAHQDPNQALTNPFQESRVTAVRHSSVAVHVVVAWRVRVLSLTRKYDHDWA